MFYSKRLAEKSLERRGSMHNGRIEQLNTGCTGRREDRNSTSVRRSFTGTQLHYPPSAGRGVRVESSLRGVFRFERCFAATKHKRHHRHIRQREGGGRRGSEGGRDMYEKIVHVLESLRKNGREDHAGPKKFIGTKYDNPFGAVVSCMNLPLS